MKKVLFVATVVKAHIMVFHIPYLKWFKENGYETYVCARNDYENKEDCVIPFCDNYYDLPFERSPIKIKNNFKTYKQLKEIINSNEFTIIHCHTPMGGALTRLAALKARRNNTNVIYTAHGFHFYKGAPITNWLLYYPVERWLARYTDVLITINKEDYERAKKSLKAGRVEYIPGVGIDTNRLNDVFVDRKTKCRDLGIPNDAFVILSVGELNKNKNHETVIKALGKLNNPNVHYVICGQGSLYSYLGEVVNQLGIEKQVHMLGFREDIGEIYRIANAFAFLSYREGLSVSLMEAMASGLPVVCSNIRGNRDLVENEKGGYLIKPDDVNGLTEIIENITYNDSLGIRMGKHNTEIIEEFSIENIKEIMANLYKKMDKNQ